MATEQQPTPGVPASLVTPNTGAPTWTWSRTSANPVEHIGDPARRYQPICGTLLSGRTQHTATRPSGLAPRCPRCERKAARLAEQAQQQTAPQR